MYCISTVCFRITQMLTHDWVAWRELWYGDSEYVRRRGTEIHHGAVGLVTHHAGDEASLLFPDSVDHIPGQGSHVGLHRGAWNQAAYRTLLSLLRDRLHQMEGENFQIQLLHTVCTINNSILYNKFLIILL